jgi:hypothetical protein
MRTLQNVIDTVREADHDKWDLSVQPDRLTMEEGVISLPVEGSTTNHRCRLQPNDWATSQLCTQLGMPASYFKRCPTELQDRQFNYWLRLHNERRESVDKEGHDRWLFRAQGTTLRAVLSDRYGRLDNAVLLGALERTIDNSFVAQSVSVTDVSFHLRLIRPTMKKMILPGDEACVGLHIANSEVGMRSVTVDALVYRLVCTNGLIKMVKGQSLFHRRHVGNGTTEALDRLPDAIKASLEAAEASMERFAQSTSVIVDDPQQTIKELGKREGFSNDFSEAIIRQLQTERSDQQNTRFGLINALTGAAHALGPDERYTVEALAGRLMEA